MTALRLPVAPIGAAPPEPAQGLDLWLSTLYGKLATRWRHPLRDLRGAANAVLRLEPRFATLDDSDLYDEAARLRVALTRAGLAELPAQQALALAREAAHRTLGLHAYPVQLMGAWALLRGMVAEMATGEGKSLTAALAAVCVALSGRPVHIVTVNDYLAARDAGVHAPLFAMLGLTVGTVVAGQAPAARQAAYGCDITYCTNKDLVFDFLRDRLAQVEASSPRQEAVRAALDRGAARTGVQRELAFAIVDEADSVLIDEARTPLIISSERNRMPVELYAQALALARTLRVEDHFLLDVTARSVVLTEAGRAALAAATTGQHGIWRSERAREQLACQALSALFLFERDRDYIVRDDKVQIVDEFTGRVLADRSWERGLHQMVEVKEAVAPTPNRDAVARMTYQRFFARYVRLAGMTGTAREVAGELWSVYGLRVAAIPTHRPVRRRIDGWRIYAADDARWQALVQRCLALREAGRAVLIGTRSVQMSERVAERLRHGGIAPVVLNAKQDADEAAVVAQAGQPGRVTVATNMAGRGTDIHLHESVRAAGGLHVILTEFHESGRIDRQLVGRCARQGDPGSCEALAALHDELFARFAASAARWAARWVAPAAELPARPAGLLRAWAQRRAERVHTAARMTTLKQDRQQERMMSFAGRRT